MKDTSIKKLSLYHYRACPFCEMTRRAIRHLNVNVELKDINKNSKDRQALINGGGKPQVPCLKITNGKNKTRWLYESADIIHYLQQL